jgi:hypothetical protein
MLETAVVDVPALDGGNEVWIEVLPARTFFTPQYGPVEVTKNKLLRFIKNFNDRVRGQDIATDYDHGADRSKGNQASGWFKELTLKPSSSDPTLPSLFARVELTDDAAREVKAKKYRYFSLEWLDEWMNNDGAKYEDVIIGGALTNRPVAKNILPINFSEAMWDELDYEEKKQFAVWTRKAINDLPDSCFLYIEPGGTKDSEGKTKPRSLRHFPYKNASGKIDLPHLRNAIARIPQSGISAAKKASLQARARRLLGGAAKAMSEMSLTEAYELLTREGFDVTRPDPDPEVTLPIPGVTDVPAVTPEDESKELEHSEPGTGSPPLPRRDGDGSDDPAITEGWRLPTPPDQTIPAGPDNPSSQHTTAVPSQTNGTAEGGKMTPEQEFELRNVLGISADGDIIEAAKLQLGELTELKRSVDAASQEHKFAEEYPAYWQEHNKLMERDRESSARQFSESVQRVRKAEGFGLKETQKGLSSMSLQKVSDLHKHFAEGTATIEEYEDTIRTIVNGGIVEFGEIGTSNSDDAIPLIDTTTATGIAGARRVFAEVVGKIQNENPDWDYVKCLNEASRKHPDLAEAYTVALPG